jgi:hypothetical protein
MMRTGVVCTWAFSQNRCPRAKLILGEERIVHGQYTGREELWTTLQLRIPRSLQGDRRVIDAE